MDYMIWIWLAVMIMALVCEGITTALVSIWFAPGAVVSMILAALEVPIWIQSVVFFAVSVVSVIVFQAVFRKKLAKGKKVATNTDRLIGEKAVVSEKIDNIRAEGCIKINGQLWSALSEDGNIIFENEIVEIVAISGVKLVCRRA